MKRVRRHLNPFGPPNPYSPLPFRAVTLAYILLFFVFGAPLFMEASYWDAVGCNAALVLIVMLVVPPLLPFLC